VQGFRRPKGVTKSSERGKKKEKLEKGVASLTGSFPVWDSIKGHVAFSSWNKGRWDRRGRVEGEARGPVSRKRSVVAAGINLATLLIKKRDKNRLWKGPTKKKGGCRPKSEIVGREPPLVGKREKSRTNGEGATTWNLVEESKMEGGMRLAATCHAEHG